MNFHVYNDGDVLRLIPIVGKDGILYNTIKVNFLYIKDIGNSCMDTTNMMNSIIFANNFRDKFKDRYSYGSKYFSNIIDKSGEIKTVLLGRTLFEIISSNDRLFEINSNYQLQIGKRNVKAGGLYDFPSYDSSIVIESTDGYIIEEDPIGYILKNQQNYNSYFEEHSPIKMKHHLERVFEHDYVSDYLQKVRDDKITKILS